jgi:hypothetical protein
VVVALAGCGARSAPATGAAGAPAPAGALLGAFAAPANGLPDVDGLAVGSLSALAFDPASRRWASASDEIQRPRLVWFELTLGAAIGVMPTSVTRIALGPGVPADTLTALDMEGLAIFPDGSFAVSHEGHIDRTGTARQPRLLRATRDGMVTAVVRPRDHFTIDPANRTRGVRHNLGFESLTRTPDGRLVTGLEQPLAQDGPVSNAAQGGLVRLVEFVEGPTGWAPGREWPYRLEPTPRVAGYDRPCEDGENGLSEMLALTDTTFLAVERACLVGPPGAAAYNPVRLFEVSVAGADDVSGRTSMAGTSPVPARKRLVVDLSGWRSRLPAALATLSNIEGMSFGPPGPRGERTVMLVSDDNFRASQTTAFIWLALR